MQHKILALEEDFAVMLGNERSQAAEMVLQPGESTGGPDNRHRGSDQWLFVVSGTGRAIVNGSELNLQPRTLLLIEHGEMHEIACAGDDPLRTLNFYVPPAYTAEGETLPPGESS
jgi:mannose-6-phosphate isomerase-like protein (cupin superfamily)